MSNSNFSWDDIMWGVSWANIQLVMADTMRYDYKNKDSDPKGGDVFDLNDANSLKMLRKMASN